MKKLFIFCFLVFTSSILFADESAEQLMEKFREKIRIEEQQKLEQLRREEEALRKAQEEQRLREEAEKREAEKLIEERRAEHAESLEKKVYRPGNDVEGQLKATDRAFEVGEQRISFVRVQEENIVAREKEKGIEKEHKEFIAGKFDEVHQKYKDTEEELEKLLKTQKEIKANLKKLEEMEKSLK